MPASLTLTDVPTPTPGSSSHATAKPTPTASAAVAANHRKVRPPSAATDFCPCRLETALTTAKNTSGVAIILMSVT